MPAAAAASAAAAVTAAAVHDHNKTICLHTNGGVIIAYNSIIYHNLLENITKIAFLLTIKIFYSIRQMGSLVELWKLLTWLT